jgi:hypothetical protein
MIRIFCDFANFLRKTLYVPNQESIQDQYDFWIYSYNASVVVPRLDRFSKQNKIFLFLKCDRLSVAL